MSAVWLVGKPAMIPSPLCELTMPRYRKVKAQGTVMAAQWADSTHSFARFCRGSTLQWPYAFATIFNDAAAFILRSEFFNQFVAIVNMPAYMVYVRGSTALWPRMAAGRCQAPANGITDRLDN